jgi:uncharacterized protein involved in exopolysaccharide biosynthesis
MSDSPEPPPLDLRASLKKPVQWALAAGLVTAIITLFMPNYYRSEAKLLPVNSASAGGMGGLAAAAAAFGVGVGGAGGTDANFTDILNSRWLSEQLLDPKAEFHYHIRSWRFGAEHLVAGSLYDYLRVENMDRAVQTLNAILNATKDLKSNVITISAETKSPDLSQAIVHRATDLLNQFVMQNSRTLGTEKAAFAEARLADARREMDQSEAALRGFLESNRNYQISADPAVRLYGARLEADLNLRRQLVNTIALNREQALMEAKNDIPILNVLDSANLPLDKSNPHRSFMVIVSTIIAFILVLGFDNRDRIRAFMENAEDQSK